MGKFFQVAEAEHFQWSLLKLRVHAGNFKGAAEVAKFWLGIEAGAKKVGLRSGAYKM